MVYVPELLPKTLYYTFIVHPRGEYSIGSAGDLVSEGLAVGSIEARVLIADGVGMGGDGTKWISYSVRLWQ